jgi:hypothetical protein
MAAQHRSTGPGAWTSIRRQFSEMTFRLFYSANTSTFGAGSSANTPALADAPTIVRVDATPEAPNKLRFLARVVGNPAAGVHAVWVTWTRWGVNCGAGVGEWQSIDLTQRTDDTTKWEGVLDLAPLGLTPKDVRFIVQAVNGVGVVGLSNNMGKYYGDAGSLEPQPKLATTLTLEPLAAMAGAFSTKITLSALLRDGSNNPIANRAVILAIGSQEQFAVTDAAGRAEVTMPLLLLPGDYKVRAAFTGDDRYRPSWATSPDLFTVVQQGTEIVVVQKATAAEVDASTQFSATLYDADGVRLLQQTVFFQFAGGGQVITKPVQTNLVGEATLAIPALPPGGYTLRVLYAGTESYKRTEVAFGAKLPQTISFGALPNKVLGDPPFNIAATASSGLPVSFVSTTPAVCTVAGNQITLVGGGQCSITASQPGNSTYLPAPNVARLFVVNDPAKQNQTITFNALPNKRLGDPPFSIAATASSGLNVSFASTTLAICTVAGNVVTLVATGQCTIRASQPGSAAFNVAPDVARSFMVTTGAVYLPLIVR